MKLVACLVVTILNHSDFPGDKRAAAVPDTQASKQPPHKEETNERTHEARVPNQHLRFLLLQMVEKRARKPLQVGQGQRPEVEEEAEAGAAEDDAETGPRTNGNPRQAQGFFEQQKGRLGKGKEEV